MVFENKTAPNGTDTDKTKKRSQITLKPLVVGAEGVEPPTLCL